MDLWSKRSISSFQPPYPSSVELGIIVGEDLVFASGREES
jgi:hypothetical protein